MYMGQITVGQESVKYFLAGIELMKKSLASATSEQVVPLFQMIYLFALKVQCCLQRRKFLVACI